MRLHDLLRETIDIRSAGFRSWFAGSKVVDARGLPLKCFHGTHMNHEIKPGGDQHFGTFAAANERIHDIYELIKTKSHDTYPPGHVSAPAIYPVYLSIKRPLTLHDCEWVDSDVITDMHIQGLIDDDTLECYMNGENDTDWKGLAVRLGFDGVRYHNEHEDKGSLSWYPFADHQVWNIFADVPY